MTLRLLLKIHALRQIFLNHATLSGQISMGQSSPQSKNDKAHMNNDIRYVSACILLYFFLGIDFEEKMKVLVTMRLISYNII